MDVQMIAQLHGFKDSFKDGSLRAIIVLINNNHEIL